MNNIAYIKLLSIIVVIIGIFLGFLYYIKKNQNKNDEEKKREKFVDSKLNGLNEFKDTLNIL